MSQKVSKERSTYIANRYARNFENNDAIRSKEQSKIVSGFLNLPKQNIPGAGSFFAFHIGVQLIKDVNDQFTHSLRVSVWPALTDEGQRFRLVTMGSEMKTILKELMGAFHNNNGGWVGRFLNSPSEDMKNMILNHVANLYGEPCMAEVVVDITIRSSTELSEQLDQKERAAALQRAEDAANGRAGQMSWSARTASDYLNCIINSFSAEYKHQCELIYMDTLSSKLGENAARSIVVYSKREDSDDGPP